MARDTRFARREDALVTMLLARPNDTIADAAIPSGEPAILSGGRIAGRDDGAPPATVVRHQSAYGEWEMVTRAPDPRLRPYMRSYHGFTESATSFTSRLEVACSDVAVIINLNGAYRVSGPAGETTAEYRSFVAGLHDSFVLVGATGLVCGLEVKLSPIGAYLLLGLSMDDIHNRTVAFEDMFGLQASALVEQLREAASWEARFQILDRALTARLAAAPSPSTEVAWAWCRLQRTRGCLDIGTLAADLGWSRKHLITRFREQIGLPPKTLARILRFNRAVRLLNRDDAPDWAEIAHDCGYYDQAHLIRDFRQFAGTTPGDFLRRRLPDGGGVIGA